MGKSQFPDPQAIWSEMEGRAALEEWRRSGESMAAFARTRGVAIARMYWWRKRLAEVRGAAPLISLVPGTVTSGPKVEVGADQVDVVVRLPNDVAIEVAAAPATWVAALVRELASA